MIRKIIIFLVAIFTFTWFVSAYFIKTKIALLIEGLETDNTKISYNKIDVSGFPNVWKVKIKEPKVKFINQINCRELSVNELEFKFDLSFKKLQISFADKIKQEQDFGDQKIYYFLEPNDIIITNLKFNKPFYKVTQKDSFDSIIKKIDIVNSELKGIFENKEIFNIKDVSLKIYKISFANKKDLNVKFMASYVGQNYLLGFNDAQLDFDAKILINNNSLNDGAEPYKVLKINNLDLKIEDSKLELNGSIENYPNKLPQGLFSVSLNNYNKIIDKLINQNFIVSKLTLKKILAKSNYLINSENILSDGQSNNVKDANFKLKLSENGIEINSLNLLDFKEED